MYCTLYFYDMKQILSFIVHISGLSVMMSAIIWMEYEKALLCFDEDLMAEEHFRI